MKRGIAAASLMAAAAVGVIVGVYVGYKRWYRVSNRPFEVRELVIRHHAAEMPAEGTIIIGDSLVERQRLDDLCGPTLNAGVGSAQTVDLIPMLRALAKTARPRLVIMEVGTNDRYYKVPLDIFISRYAEMIDEAAPARVAVVGIPGDVEANDRLKLLAAEKHAAFIPAIDPAGVTTDGVHFTPEGGARWKASVRPVCKS